MMNFLQKLEADLSQKLHFIHCEIAEPIAQADQCLNEVQYAVDKINSSVRRYKFQTVGEEINFFKHTKPHFVSKLIYYSEVFQMETRKPAGGKSSLNDYYNSWLTELRLFTEYNLDFYKYYRGRQTYLDQAYFTRGTVNLKLVANSAACQFDPRTCTSHDYTVAKIMANDRLVLYITEKLEDMHSPPSKYTSLSEGLKWKETKTALVELLYALHFSEAFEGQDIKRLAQVTEKVFDIELGDIYRTFTELKTRNNPTKFLDTMRSRMLKKIDEEFA